MVTDFTEALNSAIERAINKLHTCVPAKVVAVEGNKLSVQPIAKIVMNNGNKVEYPIISDVPIFFPSVNGCNIVIPVKKGDNCLLLFAEQSLDAWSGEGETYSNEKYALNNAIALVGFAPQVNSSLIAEANNHNAVVISGNVRVHGTIKEV